MQNLHLCLDGELPSMKKMIGPQMCVRVLIARLCTYLHSRALTQILRLPKIALFCVPKIALFCVFLEKHTVCYSILSSALSAK